MHAIQSCTESTKIRRMEIEKILAMNVKEHVQKKW